jgi:hypothetical protein
MITITLGRSGFGADAVALETAKGPAQADSHAAPSAIASFTPGLDAGSVIVLVPGFMCSLPGRDSGGVQQSALGLTSISKKWRQFDFAIANTICQRHSPPDGGDA